MDIKYANACREVLVLFDYFLDEDDLIKIPQEQFEHMKKNANSQYIYVVDGTGYPDQDRITDERWDLSDELVSQIINNVMNGEPLNAEEIKKIEDRLLELSQEEVGICQGILEKRKPKEFETPEVKANYEMIKNIEGLAIPEESKKEVVSTIKTKTKEQVTRRRKMDAFTKLALSGEKVPTDSDIKKASRAIGFNEEKEM